MAKGVSQALNNVVNCLPGQRDVDEAIEGINKVSAVLSESEPTVSICLSKSSKSIFSDCNA